MKGEKSATPEDYQLQSTYDAIRDVLLEPAYAEQRKRALAYWALPSDRRLPMAFLGRPLQELLETPFDELAATAGVGAKKLRALVTLLRRATNDSREEVHSEDVAMPEMNGQFDAEAVCESHWFKWCETIKRLNLGNIALGRLAASLQMMPTVIWNTPFSTYCDSSLTDIRNMRTHGEKRVSAILEVFHAVHLMLGHADPQSHIAFRPCPSFVVPIESWLDRAIYARQLPGEDELRAGVARPLVDQIAVDAGPQVADLAARRLGLAGEVESVRDQASEIGVTRARVYQLLEECGLVMNTRWPEGRYKLVFLGQRYEISGKREVENFFWVMHDLFFPEKLGRDANR